MSESVTPAQAQAKATADRQAAEKAEADRVAAANADKAEKDAAASAMTPKNRNLTRGPAEVPEKAQSQPQPQQVTLDPTVLAMAMVAAQTAMNNRGAQLLPTEGLDETVPGGRYKVDGVWVNAHGQRLKTGDDGLPVDPEGDGPHPLDDGKE